MTVSLIFWFLGPSLGLISVILSVYLADLDLASLASYTGVLASLYFVAVSTSAVACAEGFELALKADKSLASPRFTLGIAVSFFFNLLYFVILLALFCKRVSHELRPVSAGNVCQQANIDASSLIIAALCICISTMIGLIFKFNLEKLNGAIGRRLIPLTQVRLYVVS